MLNFKEKEFTLNTFLKATKEVGDTLSYVGTYYESPMLDSNIIATPDLGVELDDNGILEVQLTLKPNVGEEVEQLKVLEQYIKALSMGFVNPKADFFKLKNQHQTPVAKFLAQNSATSTIQDYTLSILMDRPTITRVETVINGVSYWQYTLKETFDFGDNVTYTHKIHTLFKEKTSDGENFFSAFVGKTLNKRDSTKVLDAIADKNITGLFIGGFRAHDIVPEEKRAYFNFYGVMDNITVRRTKQAYSILMQNGGMVIPYESINAISVERVGTGTGRYVITVFTPGMEIELFLG